MFLFKYSEKADRNAYYYLQKANLRKNGKTRIAVLIIRLFFTVMGIYLLYQTGKLIRMYIDFRYTQWPVVALSAVVGVLSLSYAVFYIRFLTNKSAKNADKNSGGIGEIRFTEDGISAVNSKMSTNLEYTSVDTVYRHGSYFFLFVSKNSAVIADMKKLSEGDPDAFPAFLKGKTGKEITDF